MIIHDYMFWQHRRSQFIAPCSNEDWGDSPAKKRFQGKDSRFPDQYQSRNDKHDVSTSFLRRFRLSLLETKLTWGLKQERLLQKIYFVFYVLELAKIWFEPKDGSELERQLWFFCQKFTINWIPQYQNFAVKKFSLHLLFVWRKTSTLFSQSPSTFYNLQRFTLKM